MCEHAPHTTAMPLGKRKTDMDDTPSETDIMDALARDMQVACDIHDNEAVDHVYALFLSVAGPGPDVVHATVFPWTLGKRKTGDEDAPSASEYYKSSHTSYRLLVMRATVQLSTAYTIGSCRNW